MEKQEVFEEAPADKEFSGGGMKRFIPLNYKGEFFYTVEKYLGAEEVQYVKNGKIVKDNPARWLIKDEWEELVLSEWSMSNFRGLGIKKATEFVGKRIQLTCNNEKKALVKIL